MPPKGERLTDRQVQLLSTWIDQGADWPDDRESLGVGRRFARATGRSARPFDLSRPS